MAFDEKLFTRIQKAIGNRKGAAERRMFGGVCVTIGGNMALGVQGDELMVRVGPDAYEDALAQPHARAMDFTGKPLKGFVYVSAAGCRDARSLRRWIDRGVSFAESLPVKKAAATGKTPAGGRSPKSPAAHR